MKVTIYTKSRPGPLEVELKDGRLKSDAVYRGGAVVKELLTIGEEATSGQPVIVSVDDLVAVVPAE